MDTLVVDSRNRPMRQLVTLICTYESEMKAGLGWETDGGESNERDVLVGEAF